MQMTIDKTISELEILKKNTFSYMSAHQAFITAIDTMHKYQKIKQIIHDDWIKGVNSGATLNKIEEVLEDGNDD